MSAADTSANRSLSWGRTHGQAGDLSHVLPWIRKAVTAIADQGLTAGSNFFLGIILARWLNPEQYGAYALAYSVFLLVAAFHQALLLEPVAVLGPSRYQERRRPYIGRVLWLQALVSLGIVALLGAAGAAAGITGHRDLAGAFYGLSIGAPCILLLWTARAACYVELAPGRAAVGSSLYCMLMVGGILIAYRAARISTFAVFVLMGTGALAASMVLFAQLRPEWRGTNGGPALREVWREHWNYGRWALGSSLVNWIPGNIFYSVTGALLGMRDAGAFRALMNLTLPVAHTASAVSLLFLPYLSRTFGEHGTAATREPVKRVTAVYALGAIAYGAIFLAGQNTIFRALYGGRFMEFSYLVPWVLAGVLFQVSSYGPCVALRAIQSPASVFRTYCWSAAVSLGIGIPATWAFGLAGAVGSTALATLGSFAVSAHLFRRKLKAA